ncbi:MAG: patatin-like phospholipase family protein [Clostridia bacterium]|nr:patatin-like phospholipase family protein [Clostridia bacterium]
MEKYGLVLAGGGGKGAYQLGAWKAMRELGVEFSAVTGVSVGSINGAFIASDCFDEAVEFWKTASVDKGVNITQELKDPEKLFSFKNLPALFKEVIKNGGIDASPTGDFLREYIDEDKVRKSGIDFGMVTFMLSEFSPLEIFIKDIPEGKLIDYLLASSKVPGVSKIGPDDERYLDGGVYDNAPIGLLRKNGYNRIVFVDISVRKGFGHRNDFSGADLIYIRPYDVEKLGAAFDFSEEMFERRIRMGYLDTRRVFGFLSGRRFYFEKDVFREMVVQFGADAVEQLEELAELTGVDDLKVYDKEGFLEELKVKYLEYQKEQELKEVETDQKFYGPIIKKLSQFGSDDKFALAEAVLNDIVV